MAAYVVSHINKALFSENYAKEQNGTSQNDVSDQKHTVVDENHIASTSLRTSWDWPYYWIYFTYWSWTLICLSFWIDTTLVVLRYRKEKARLHYVVGESKNTSCVKGSHNTLKDTSTLRFYVFT